LDEHNYLVVHRRLSVVVVFSMFVVVAEPLAQHQRKLQAGCWVLGSGWRLAVELEVAEVQQARQPKNLIYR
jgi:hypothetical protein